MTALLLSLGASLAWGVGDFGAGTAGRSRSPVAVALMMRFGGFVAIALLALVLTSPWDSGRLGYAVGAGVATALGGTALVRALAIGPMGSPRRSSPPAAPCRRSSASSAAPAWAR